MSELQVRALLPEDAAAARVLLLQQFGGTRYEARMLQLLALAGNDGEHEGAVVVDGDGTICAVIVFGPVAGASGVERIDCLAGNELALDGALGWALSSARRKAARLVIAELPASSEFDAFAHILSMASFREESCIAEFVRAGIGLRLFRMRLS